MIIVKVCFLMTFLWFQINVEFYWINWFKSRQQCFSLWLLLWENWCHREYLVPKSMDWNGFFCFLWKSLIESWGTEFSLNPVPVIKYFNYVMSKTFTTSFIWIFLVPKIADAEVFADLDQENWGEADSKLSVSVLL